MTHSTGRSTSRSSSAYSSSGNGTGTGTGTGGDPSSTSRTTSLSSSAHSGSSGSGSGDDRRSTGRPSARRGRLAAVALTLASTAVLAGCSALGIGSGAGLGGDWGLVSGDDPAGDFDLSVADVSMTVQGDAISGVAACNTYGGTVIGSVAEVEQPLRVEQLFQTEMACLDDGVMELEQRYLDALAAVTSARRINADTVELIGPGVRLEFDLLVEG